MTARPTVVKQRAPLPTEETCRGFNLIRDFLKFPERETYTLIQSKYDDDKFALANEAGDGDDANRYKIGEFSGSDTQSPEVVAMLNTFQTVINTGATATDVVAGSVDVPRSADAASGAFYANHARGGAAMGIAIMIVYFRSRFLCQPTRPIKSKGISLPARLVSRGGATCLISAFVNQRSARCPPMRMDAP